MDSFYEEMYEYLISEGIEDDEATEVVNYLFEDNIHEYGLITENKGRAFLNMLKAVGYMSGVLKTPGAKTAVKATVNKITSGNLRQGKLLTKTGKAQDFTKGKMPFTGTDPVPAASSKLPQPAVPASQAPGQMRIPGMSDRAQDLRNVTRNPNLGLPGNTKGFGVASPMPKPKPPAPPTSDAVSQAVRNLGRTSTPPTVSKVDKVIGAVKKSALPVGVAGATGLALSGGKGPKKSEDPRRPDGSLPPYTPPRPPADPEPEVKSEPKVKVEPPKEKPTRSASELSSAAKSFDKAFAVARKEGKKEFTWRGKQYNTKYKGE